jgi:hypothetical protein
MDDYDYDYVVVNIKLTLSCVLSIIPAMHKGKLVKLFVSCIITQSQIYNEQLASCSGHFTARKGDTSIHSRGGWVSPTNPDRTAITINLSIYANRYSILAETPSLLAL